MMSDGRLRCVLVEGGGLNLNFKDENRMTDLCLDLSQLAHVRYFPLEGLA